MTALPLPNTPPETLPVNLAGIPDALKEIPHWAVWRWVWKEEDSRWNKVPINARTGQFASHSNPATWATFDRAVGAMGRFDAAGLVFALGEGAGIVAVDKDHCVTFEELDDDAAALVAQCASYAERSPTDGLHIFGYGQIPGIRRRNTRIEFYQEHRFMTVTGHAFEGYTAVSPMQDALDALYLAEFGIDPESRQDVECQDGDELGDDEVLGLIRGASNAQRFLTLWDGAVDENGGMSGGDLGLCNLLVFYCDDPYQVDRLIRQSARMRGKWDSRRGQSTYGMNTIRKALRERKERYRRRAALTLVAHRHETNPETDPVVEEDAADGKLPIINVTDKRLRDVVTESLEALGTVESLYQRGGVLLRLKRDDTGRIISDPLDNDALRGMLERGADYLRYEPRRKRNLPVAPPLDLVRDLQALPDYSFRILAGIIETPVTRSDGTIVSIPGYDGQSRLFYEPPPGLCIPAIPEEPDDDDVRTAVAIYDEMLKDFPFADAAGKAHAMAMALTPFVRDMINGPTPMGMIDAPGPAAGKGLLADAICMPAFGPMLGNLGECGDDAEWRKQITSVLMESTRIVRIDNIANILDSTSLARALTTLVWEDRVLGGNKIARIPVRCTWLGTGNNVISSTEIARRTLPIRLDPNEEQPQFRTGFTHINLRAWARSKRGELIAAALTLIRAWHNWGQPPGKVTIGSYEEWSTVLGGILEMAGIEGFLANTAEQHDPADSEMAMWGDFVQAWWATHKQKTVLAKDLIELAWDSNIPLRGTSPHAQKVELGMAIRHQRGRVIAGKKIAFTYNSDTKVTHWWLNPNPRDKNAQPSGAEEL